MSEQHVDMNEVGFAEDVLNRLVNERKSLENAQRVLQTYRAAKVDLVSLGEELTVLKGNVAAARAELNGVETSRDKAVQAAEDFIKEYRDKAIAEVNVEIKRLNGQIEQLEVTYQEMEDMYIKDKKEFEEEIGMLKVEIEAKKADLEKLRVEHGALAEAISNAAMFFQRKS